MGVSRWSRQDGVFLVSTVEGYTGITSIHSDQASGLISPGAFYYGVDEYPGL